MALDFSKFNIPDVHAHVDGNVLVVVTDKSIVGVDIRSIPSTMGIYSTRVFPSGFKVEFNLQFDAREVAEFLCSKWEEEDKFNVQRCLVESGEEFNVPSFLSHE